MNSRKAVPEIYYSRSNAAAWVSVPSPCSGMRAIGSWFSCPRPRCYATLVAPDWLVRAKASAPNWTNFQPTTQPTKCAVFYDFRVLWQSPRSCKSL